MSDNKGIILIVEDNKKLLEINRRLLSGDDCEVYTAGTLCEAREVLKAVLPDIAVLDIMLPDGDGLGFAGELRNICRASIIFLTARTQKKDMLAGFAEGAIHYITKPYDTETFRMMVMNLLADIVSSRSPKPPSLLSEEELAVARLAIAGEYTKNIAAALCVSERCVKARLTRIYKKLCIGGDDNEKRRKLTETLAAHLSDPQFR